MGTLLSLRLPADAAATLALGMDGSEPADELHVTLCFLEQSDAQTVQAARAAVAACAVACEPLVGVSNGRGIFRDVVKDGAPADAFWAAVDVVGLAEFRDEVCEALCAAGLEPSEAHGWCPHITLGYIEPGTTVGIPPSDPVPLAFDALTISDDQGDRVDLPLLGVLFMKDDPGSADVHVDVPLGSDKPRKRRRRGRGPMPNAAVSVIKADDEQQIVAGIVLQPGVADSQGDICTAAEIEKTAHRFLYNQVPIGLQHDRLAPDDVRPVESYLAPVDFVADTPRGPEQVLKGTWIVAAHIPDPALWHLIKTDGFTGWSIAGTGKRTPITA